MAAASSPRLVQKYKKLGTKWVSRCFGGVCWNASLVNPAGNGARGPSVEVWHGTWGEAQYLEPIFTSALRGTCFQDDGTRKVVVDIGANIGLYSAYFAMQGCIVHAFEPLEINADHVEMTSQANGLSERLHLHRIAASQVPRNVTLRWSFKETGLTHVVKDGETKTNSSNRYVAGARRSVGMYWHEQRQVPARRIDEVLSSVSDVAWMKVDVEVRMGAKRALPSSFAISLPGLISHALTLL